MRIKFTYDDKAFQAKAQAFLKQASGAGRRELLNGIGITVQKDVENHFKTETDSSGAKWKPSQRAAATGGKTLNNYGHLRTIMFDVQNENRVRIGTGVNYGEVHDRGGKSSYEIVPKNGGNKLKWHDWPTGNTIYARKVTRKAMPKREWLYISTAGRTNLMKTLAYFYIKYGFKTA